VDALATAYGRSQGLLGVSSEWAGRRAVPCRPQRHGQGPPGAIAHGHGAPPRGHDRVRGRPLHDCHRTAWRRRGWPRCRKGRQVFPNITVRENLVATSSPGEFPQPNSDPRAQIRDLPGSLAERARDTSAARLRRGSSRCSPSGEPWMDQSGGMLILDGGHRRHRAARRVEIYRGSEGLKDSGRAILDHRQDPCRLTRSPTADEPDREGPGRLEAGLDELAANRRAHAPLSGRIRNPGPRAARLPASFVRNTLRAVLSIKEPCKSVSGRDRRPCCATSASSLRRGDYVAVMGEWESGNRRCQSHRRAGAGPIPGRCSGTVRPCARSADDGHPDPPQAMGSCSRRFHILFT